MPEAARRIEIEPRVILPRTINEPSRVTTGQELGDLRFRALVGSHGWGKLPAAVRHRFSHRLAAGRTVVYVGRTTKLERSLAGALLAQLLRPLGAPLPLSSDVGTASVVSVTEDASGGGQVWTRLYAKQRGFPQIIHSSKRFSGPTGLEEHIGRGVLMALRVEAQPDGLVFRSAGYVATLFGRRFALPGWLTPGELTVQHMDGGGGAFTFSLTLQHPLFGRLLEQVGIYRDTHA